MIINIEMPFSSYFHNCYNDSNNTDFFKKEIFMLFFFHLEFVNCYKEFGWARVNLGRYCQDEKKVMEDCIKSK